MKNILSIISGIAVVLIAAFIMAIATSIVDLKASDSRQDAVINSIDKNLEEIKTDIKLLLMKIK